MPLRNRLRRALLPGSRRKVFTLADSPPDRAEISSTSSGTASVDTDEGNTTLGSSTLATAGTVDPFADVRDRMELLAAADRETFVADHSQHSHKGGEPSIPTFVAYVSPAT